MSQPPKHDSTLEMTAVLPRAPISSPLLAAMDLDPEHPETRELMAEAIRNDVKTRETMVPCPGTCRACPCCHGATSMVSGTRAREYLEAAAKLLLPDEPCADHE